MITEVHLIPGTGTATSAGAHTVVWSHTLGTATPQLALFQLVETSPEKWRFVPPNEYDARGTSVALTLTFASTPPTQGHVGALKLIACRLDAAPSAALSSSTSGGIVSPRQLANFRARASAMLAATFPTAITIGERVDIPAARWSLTRGERPELAGLMPTSVIAIRVERAAIAGLNIVEGRTQLVEDGRHFRINQVRDAKGDPALVLECTAA